MNIYCWQIAAGINPAGFTHVSYEIFNPFFKSERQLQV